MVKQGSVYFLLCPKQGPIIEGVVLHRVCILGYFCSKQGQLVKPSAAPLYPIPYSSLPPETCDVAARDSGDRRVQGMEPDIMNGSILQLNCASICLLALF